MRRRRREFRGGVCWRIKTHNVQCARPTDNPQNRARTMEIYAVANVIIWPIGVPVGLMIWLRSLSIYLDPVGMTEEEAIAVRRTDEHIKSSAVAFLALYHKPRYWYVMNIGGRKESPFCLIAARSILLRRCCVSGCST